MSSSALPDWLRAFPGIVAHVARDGRVTESNGRLEAALGHDVEGRTFAELVDPDSSGAKWARLLASGGTGVWELTLAGGDTLPEPRAFSALPNADGVWLVEHPRDARHEALRATATEVNSELANTQRELLRERSRRERAMAELERSNRALDEFAHAVSHDLKAPLRSIGHVATWIAEDLGDAAQLRAHSEMLGAQVARMQALIAGVLGYARAGRQRSTPESIDVGALLREIVALLDPPPGAIVEIDDAMPVLETARAPLHQVLQNLVGNALKHARRADVRVRVSARVAGDVVEFTVADNGPGIAPRQQERIWNLFQTLEPTEDSSGIGLAVVRRIVESEGGRVWVESEEGAGAKFHFTWRTH